MYCRGCFCSEKNMQDITITPLNQYLLEAIDISVGPCDLEWRWLCWECEALLLKLVRFRQKVIRKHTIIQHYQQQQLSVPENIILQELCLKKYPDLAKTQRIEQSYFLPETNDDNKITIKVEFPYGDDIVINTEKADRESNIDESTNYVTENFSNSSHNSENPTNSEEMLKCENEDIEETFISDETFVSDSYGNSPVQTEVKDKVESQKVNILGNKESFSTLDPTKFKMITLTEDEQRDVLAERLASEDFQRFPHRCTKCARGFNFKQKFDKHLELHDETAGDFECHLCLVRFRLEKSWRRHTKEHTRQYQCITCKLISPNKKVIETHYKRLHEGIVKEFRCKYCEKTFKSWMTHKSHEQCHEGVKIECEKCGKKFSSIQNRDFHQMVYCKKEKLKKEFGCDKCDLKFFTPSAVKLHQLVHSTDNAVYCEPCGTFYKNKPILLQHLKTSSAHIDQTTLRYPCPKCPRRFPFERLLRYHDMNYHSGNTFTCETCGKIFKAKKDINKHMRTVHQGLKKGRDFICDVCGKGFTVKRILTNHIRTHTGERPFVCKLCGRAFTQKVSLNTHNKLVHLKIKRVVNRNKKIK